MALATTKNAEQNRVWVGLSKETAHQLGTPISSLLAWIEILKSNYPDDSMIDDMGNDINRLKTIAERFSKIGSKSEFELVNINDTLRLMVQSTINSMQADGYVDVKSGNVHTLLDLAGNTLKLNGNS